MYICIPIRRKKFKALLREFHNAQKLCDITEVWFDSLKNPKQHEIDSLLKIKIKPLLYKFEKWNKLTEFVLKSADYVDVDISNSKNILKKIRKISPKVKIIISFHDFKKTPTDKKLREIVSVISKKNPDIVKISCMANGYGDSLRMLSLLQELCSRGMKAICLSMGEKGRITRTAGHLFGNYLTYAPLSLSKKTAPGQIDVKELREIIK